MRWYEVKAQGEDDAEILIYDEIGAFGLTAKDFVQDVKALGDIKNLTLRINSYGGEVFAGTAIYNFLQRHPANKTVWVDGIAASIASVIAMAGDRVIMPDNAFMMIHRSWGLVIGNAEDMEQWADTMRKFDQSIIQAYQRRSSMSAKEIEQLMSDETWLTAAEAKAGGFADEISEPVQLAARATFRVFDKLPEALGPVPSAEEDPPPETTEPEPEPEPEPEQATAPEAEPEPTTEPESQPAAGKVIVSINGDIIPHPKAAADKTKDEIRAEAQAEAQEIVRLCAEAEVPDAATEFMNRGMNTAQVKERLAQGPAIRDACTAARLPDRAAGYIKGTLSVTEIRAELFEAIKNRDPHEIIGQHGPELQNKQPVIDMKEIYAFNYPKRRR